MRGKMLVAALVFCAPIQACGGEQASPAAESVSLPAGPESVTPEEPDAVANSDPSDAAPQFLPIFITETGEGILRYSANGGVDKQYWLAIGTRTNSPERPFETFSGDIGPYAGPDVAISFAYIKHSQIRLEDIAFELYEREPYRMIARFVPVVDTANAEPASACGDVSPIGECSIKAR